MTHTPSALIHLRAAGVSLLLDATEGRLPAVLHWGADLGELRPDDAVALAIAAVPPRVNNTVDEPIRLAILPEHHTGWSGRPGIAGHRGGAGWSPRFTVDELRVEGTGVEGAWLETGAGVVTATAEDPAALLAVSLEIELLPSGLVRTRAGVTSTAAADDAPYDLEGVLLALPIPQRAAELLDFAGRWGKERVPQRSPLPVGIHDREGRKGRTGADAATLLSAGEPGFGFRRGEVWGVHVAWSGDHRHYAERLSTGAQVLGGGELLLPGEVRLGAGESYSSPWVYGAYGDGLDAQAARFHRYLRARGSHPARPRPVTLNVWEAVYFDHDLARLTDLAERAAALGVERYVLDDGWFRHRRNDDAGLGDWYVDETVWPDGLSPLIERVTGLGMEFGLWFEPEMVNEDSDLFRAHPEWAMQTGGRLPVRARQQQVLNLGLPDAFDHVLGRMTAILDEYDIAYIKWDHNRDLVDAGSWPTGRAGVHEQTLAAYRLMATLKERFPGLEIESCASGGARVDLGVIEHTDRVWVSDCIDPLERQGMVRWTSQLLPPELLGAHVADGVNHTTGRAHPLSFRAGTAVYGHLGIEWDLARATAAELGELAEWIELHKAHRALLASGDVVRADPFDDGVDVHGVVAADRASALFFVAFVGRSVVAPPGRFTLPGLDPEVRYRVEPVRVGDQDPGLRWPDWAASGAGVGAGAGVVLPGRALASAGLQTPASFPERVLLLRVTADAGA
jgi:alpha-galactosidase